jgi:hypothetical protein
MASECPLLGKQSPMASAAVRAYGRSDRRNPTPQRNPLPPSSPPPPRPSPPPRPLPADVIDRGHRYTISQRVQCLTLLVEGFSQKEVEQRTGVKRPAQTYIKKRAFKRGFRPEVDP